MSRKPRESLTIAARPDNVELLDRHLALSAIWGSICRLGTAIRQQVRDIVLDLSDAGKQTGQEQPRPDASKKYEPK